MTSLSWRFREWLLKPLINLVEEDMAKDRDAAEQLKQLLATQSDAISAVEANVSADEETDWSVLQPLVAQAAANNARLSRLAGVNADGSTPGNPVNPVTGESPNLGDGSNVSVDDPNATVTPPPNADANTDGNNVPS